MELWSATHAKTLIPSMVVMLIVSILLRFLLIKKDLKIRMIPFQILAVIILLIEAGKQITSLINGYDLYHLPFHVCSIFIYMLPISAFYKGKYREKVFSITSALCCAVFLFLAIYPCLIYSADNIKNFFNGFFDFHTVAFHNIVVFEFFLIITLDLNQPEGKSDLLPIAVFMAVFSIVSAIMAQLLKTNFANMYSCNIPPLENLRLLVQDAWGYVPAQILYVTIVGTLHIVFSIGSYYLFVLIKNTVKKLSGKD